MTPIDLCEMDIVLKRNGMVCWVLKNDFDHDLQLFNVDLWGQQKLRNYDSKFRYTGGENLSLMSKRERKPYQEHDIIAIYKSESKWKLLNLMYNYKSIMKSNNKNIIERMSEFDWQFINK